MPPARINIDISEVITETEVEQVVEQLSDMDHVPQPRRATIFRKNVTRGPLGTRISMPVYVPANLCTSTRVGLID